MLHTLPTYFFQPASGISSTLAGRIIGSVPQRYILPPTPLHSAGLRSSATGAGQGGAPLLYSLANCSRVSAIHRPRPCSASSCSLSMAFSVRRIRMMDLSAAGGLLASSVMSGLAAARAAGAGAGAAERGEATSAAAGRSGTSSTHWKSSKRFGRLMPRELRPSETREGEAATGVLKVDTDTPGQLRRLSDCVGSTLAHQW